MQTRDFTPADPDAASPKVRMHIPELGRRHSVIAPDGGI